jgi:hypothetical protein
MTESTQTVDCPYCSAEQAVKKSGEYICCDCAKFFRCASGLQWDYQVPQPPKEKEFEGTAQTLEDSLLNILNRVGIAFNRFGPAIRVKELLGLILQAISIGNAPTEKALKEMGTKLDAAEHRIDELEKLIKNTH